MHGLHRTRINYVDGEKLVLSWGFEGRILPSISRGGFFIKVSQNGTIVAIGGPHDGVGGQVQAYRKEDNYALYGHTLNGHNANDYFGGSIALSEAGNVLAVGGCKPA